MCNKNHNKNISELSIKLTEYMNVFFKKIVRKFFFYESKDHAINLNKNNLFYKLIYSLLIIKLKTL